jgi:hypothetical protein
LRSRYAMAIVTLLLTPTMQWMSTLLSLLARYMKS